MFPSFLSWSYLEQYALRKWIKGVFDLKLSIAAIGDESVHLLHALRYLLKALHEVIVPFLFQVVQDLPFFEYHVAEILESFLFLLVVKVYFFVLVYHFDIWLLFLNFLSNSHRSIFDFLFEGNKVLVDLVIVKRVFDQFFVKKELVCFLRVVFLLILLCFIFLINLRLLQNTLKLFQHFLVRLLIFTDFFLKAFDVSCNLVLMLLFLAYLILNLLQLRLQAAQVFLHLIVVIFEYLQFL